MKGITDRQKEILTFISNYTEQNSYPPTVRDISEHFDISLRAVQDLIAALQKKGFLEKSQKRARSLRVISDTHDKEPELYVGKVPLLGSVAAGKPLLSEENLDGYVNLTEPFVRPGKSYFALRVRGQSMINAGIFDGDHIFVEKCNTARNGDTVVALIDDSATVKTFYKEDGHIRLQPENDTMDPIIVDNCDIIGKVFGVFRFF